MKSNIFIKINNRKRITDEKDKAANYCMKHFKYAEVYVLFASLNSFYNY